jgi:hypothetical protein
VAAGVVAIAGQQPRPKDVKVKPHTRHRQRTAAEKDASLRVAGTEAAALRTVFDHRVNGQPVGNIAWGELKAMVRDNANDAADFLHLGTEATANAILLWKIHQFAQVEDYYTKVRKVVSAEQLQTFVNEARAEAPEFVKAGIRKYSDAVDKNDLKEIAA